MTHNYLSTLEICTRHAARLAWARASLRARFPLSAETIQELSEEELAILDQFTTHFSKLQDAMAAKLFPAVLELTKEQGTLVAFLDKLHRLEKLGAIPSADNWLLLCEVRNQFAHDYPDDPIIEAATLNQAYALADDLLNVLGHIEGFAKNYTA